MTHILERIENRLDHIERQLRLLTWMAGFNLVLTLAALALVCTIKP
jgi:hypothetical protein